MYIAPRRAYSTDPMYVAPVNKSAPHAHPKPPAPRRPLMPTWMLDEEIIPEQPWCVIHQWDCQHLQCQQCALRMAWWRRY
eukprot:1837767-Heterocapsa_arctica.AAC.1